MIHERSLNDLITNQQTQKMRPYVSNNLTKISSGLFCWLANVSQWPSILFM